MVFWFFQIPKDDVIMVSHLAMSRSWNGRRHGVDRFDTLYDILKGPWIDLKKVDIPIPTETRCELHSLKTPEREEKYMQSGILRAPWK